MSGHRRPPGGRRRKQRRPRVGDPRRRLLCACLSLVLVTSMIISVRRTAEGHRLSESLNELSRREQRVRTRLAEELVRVDSLSSRDRILRAAARLGLRNPEDHEIVHLADIIAEGSGAMVR